MPESRENQRLVMVSSGGGINCRTFVFKQEGHTLGNSLRSVIMQNPQVVFCGYSLPHPAEDQMHLRIQTIEKVDAQDALLKGIWPIFGRFTVYFWSVFGLFFVHIWSIFNRSKTCGLERFYISDL